MSRQTIQQLINSGVEIPPLDMGEVTETIDRATPFIRKIELTKNDTMQVSLKVLSSLMSPDFTISFYRVVNKVVYSYSSRKTQAWNFSFNQELLAEEYVIEITNSVSSVVTLETFIQGFVPTAKIATTFWAGEYLVGELTTKRKPVGECKEELEYEMIDGELPPGLKLLPSGIIEGVVENLDCVPTTNKDETYSPSFNWYFSNHDGMSQSWARRWRFKVRVKIKNMADTYVDEWFCLKVFNNWSLDAAIYDSATDDDTVILDEYKSVKLQELSQPKPKEETQFLPAGLEVIPDYYQEVVDCLPCNDPTTPSMTETYTIPDGLRIRTPNELVHYYVKYEMHFEPLVMQLHNSEILKEYISIMGDNTPNPTEVYEILIDGSTLTLNKYFLDNGRAFTDLDNDILAMRNITNQVAPLNIMATMGESMTGVLTW